MTWHRMWPILVLCFTGCSAVIRPPTVAPADAVPVLIADYGYHSTLILPRPNGGGMIEYAYGDWNYFGQNRKSIGTAIHALMASDQATLGRRVLDRDPNQPGLKEAIGANSILTFQAARDKVEDLERALEQRFSARLDSIVYSPVHKLYFVKDEEPYGVAHNCNHFTAQFIERLGCRVDGMVLTSKFRLSSDPAAPSAPADMPTPSARRQVRDTARTASQGQVRLDRQ
jgi:hypothetical protein